MAKPIKRIEVKRDQCIGASSCVAVAGSVFELDGDNKAVLILNHNQKNSGPAERGQVADARVADETLRTAAQSCPTHAIFLYDEDGQEIK